MQSDEQRVRKLLRTLKDDNLGITPPLEIVWALLSLTHGEEPSEAVGHATTDADAVESWQVTALTDRHVIEVRGTARQELGILGNQPRHSDDALATARRREDVATVGAAPIDYGAWYSWTTKWHVTFTDGTRIDLPTGTPESEQRSDAIAVELLRSLSRQAAPGSEDTPRG